MPTPSDTVSQFIEPDQLRVVVDDAGGVSWEICSGGVCLQDRNGARVMERYRLLRCSQGRLAPLS